MNTRSWIALISLFGIVFSGCTDEPNSVGVGLVPSKDAIRVDSLKFNATATMTDTANVHGTDTTILVGKYKHLEASTLIEFDGFPVDKPSATIDSAVLTLHLNYRFKDPSGALDLEVHRLLTPWNGTTLIWDSLQAGSFYVTAADTTFKGFQVNAQDSTLSIRIDPVVRTWFQAENASPYGILLMVWPLTTSNFVAGFATYANIYGDFRPTLTVGYHDSTALDTTTLVLVPSQHVFLAHSDLPAPTDSLYIQAGVAYRGKVSFDLSALPKGVSITQATMSLHLDSAGSLRNSYTLNQVEARAALDTTSVPALSTYFSEGTPSAQDSSTFTFDLKNFVQLWVKGTANYGIVLRSYNEVHSVDGFMFHGASADSAHRPTLNVQFTSFPKKATVRPR